MQIFDINEQTSIDDIKNIPLEFEAVKTSKNTTVAEIRAIPTRVKTVYINGNITTTHTIYLFIQIESTSN